MGRIVENGRVPSVQSFGAVVHNVRFAFSETVHVMDLAVKTAQSKSVTNRRTSQVLCLLQRRLVKYFGS